MDNPFEVAFQTIFNFACKDDRTQVAGNYLEDKVAMASFDSSSFTATSIVFAIIAFTSSSVGLRHFKEEVLKNMVEVAHPVVKDSILGSKDLWAFASMDLETAWDSSTASSTLTFLDCCSGY
jgi:hypothetical protein